MREVKISLGEKDTVKILRDRLFDLPDEMRFIDVTTQQELVFRDDK
jgi:hypothetical protein